MDITNFPIDIFLLVVNHLSSKDCIRARRVSQRWLATFTEPTLARHILQVLHPRAREVRRAVSGNERTSLDDIAWSEILSRVSGRYDALGSGRPRSIVTLPLARSLVLPEFARRYDVGVWQRYLNFENKTALFHYADTLWTYEDGILIFPSAERQDYVLYDLDTGLYGRIAFEPRGKIVRRTRLQDGVLLIEWCEAKPYHQLNDHETVFRHYATAYDIIFSDGHWTTVFRNEWKIHFLGLPLNPCDLFYSTHNATTYAIYIWQPNRSAWGEDEPLETLAIWDITVPSSYRPSEDTSGKHRLDQALTGPRFVRRLSLAELDFYGIRQRSTPTLRELALDEQHVYVISEDHRW